MRQQNRQHKSGFTLIEIAATVFILGLLLTAILQLQSYVIAASSHARNRVVRSIRLWNAYVYAQRQPWYQQQEEQQDNFLTDDIMRYDYNHETVSEQSALAPYSQSGVMEYITGTQEDGAQTQLVLYRYQPSEQEAAE